MVPCRTLLTNDSATSDGVVGRSTALGSIPSTVKAGEGGVRSEASVGASVCASAMRGPASTANAARMLTRKTSWRVTSGQHVGDEVPRDAFVLLHLDGVGKDFGGEAAGERVLDRRLVRGPADVLDGGDRLQHRPAQVLAVLSDPGRTGRIYRNRTPVEPQRRPAHLAVADLHLEENRRVLLDLIEIGVGHQDVAIHT